MEDIDHLKQVWGGPLEWLGLEHLACKERMGEVDLFSLEKEELWGHLTAALNPYGGHQEDRTMVFIMTPGGRIKAHVN